MNLIEHLQNTNKRTWFFIAFYITISLFVNACFFYVYTIEGSWSKSLQSLLVNTGDGKLYIGSAENYYKTSNFTLYKTDSEPQFHTNFIEKGDFNKGIYYAHRTPGYAFMYLPFRLFLNYENTLYFLLFLQILLNAIAKFTLAIIVYRIINKPISFYIAFILSNLSFTLPYYNHLLLTESFAGSFVIFSLFFLQSAFIKKQYLLIVVSSICLTQAVLLRPFLLPIFIIIIGIQWLEYKKLSYFISKQFLFLIIPLCIVLIPWTIRNYVKTNEFIPLSRTLEYFDFTNKAFQQAVAITYNSSENIEWWKLYTLTHWLQDEKMTYNISKCALVKGFDKQTLLNMEQARILYIQSKDTNSYTLQQRKQFETKSEQILIIAGEKYKELHPYYYITSKIQRLLKYMNVPLNRPFNSRHPIIKIPAIFIEGFINYLIMIGGSIVSIWYLFGKRSSIIKIIAFSSIFILLYFSISRFFEAREVFLIYVLNCILVAHCISDFATKKIFHLFSSE